MPDMLVGEARAFDVQLVDGIDIDAVGADRIAAAVASELAVDDADCAAGDIAGQDAVFVVEEPAVLHRQVAALDPDASAVAIGHPGAGEGQVADRDVAALGDEDCLAATGFVGQDHSGAAALDGQSAGVPYGAVVVLAWRDADDVARLCQRRSLAWQHEPLTWPHLKHAAGTRFSGTGWQQHDDDACRQSGPLPLASIIHATHRAIRRVGRLYTVTIPTAQGARCRDPAAGEHSP